MDNAVNSDSTRILIKSATDGPDGVKNSSEILIEGLSSADAAHVLDKPHAKLKEQVYRKDGSTAWDLVKEELGNDPPVKDKIAKDPPAKGGTNVKAPKMIAKGLDLKEFDIRKPGDIIQVIRDLIEDADLKVQTSKDGKKRNFDIQLTIAGKKFDFKSDDLNELREIVSGTGLDLENDPGGEIIEENKNPEKEPLTKLIRKFRSTADGDDDTIQNENENILTQTKVAFIVTTLLDVNLNSGINGTLAIFIA